MATSEHSGSTPDRTPSPASGDVPNPTASVPTVVWETSPHFLTLRLICSPRQTLQNLSSNSANHSANRHVLLCQPAIIFFITIVNQFLVKCCKYVMQYRCTNVLQITLSLSLLAQTLGN